MSDGLQTAAGTFLERDFNRVFEQVRYYDTQIVDIFKYLATFYTTVAGLVIGLYQWSADKSIDIQGGLMAGMSIALLFGLLIIPTVVKNRVYFVRCMRYINEHRQIFLAAKPLGFENKSRMYTDPAEPPFFRIFSSQSCWLYALAVLNSLLLGLICYMSKADGWVSITSPSLLLIGQLVAGIVHLRAEERRSS